MMTRRIIPIVKAAAQGAVCVLLLVYAQGSREGAAQGVRLCLSVLVPSLFPFMAVTQLFVHTGLCQRAGKVLHRPARALFGLSGAFAPVILLCLVGGYPVGAGGIAALYRQGAVSRREAERAALFAVCAGPGYVVSFVGAAVYGSRETGLVLFGAQSVSVLVTGIVSGLLCRSSEKDNSISENSSASLPFAQALVESVEGASRGMLTICAFVVFFSSLTGIAAQLLPDGAALDGLFLLTEVSGAVTRCADTRSVTAVAFAVGFGGLCVHCQIFAALGEVRVSKPLFFLFRIIQGFLTAALTRLGLGLLPRTAAVFSTATAKEAAFCGGSIVSGAVLLGVMVCFLVTVKQTMPRGIWRGLRRRSGNNNL